jgi:hypothetical protein
MTPADSVLGTFVLQWMIPRWNRERFVRDSKIEELPTGFVTQVASIALGRTEIASMGECVNKLRAMYHRI